MSGKFCLWKSVLIKAAFSNMLCLQKNGRLFSFFFCKPATMIVNENNSMPYMKSLTSCLAKIVNDGYSEDFKVTDNGLEAVQHQRAYSPAEIQVINFFRFEGESDPDDNAILYVIETSDGIKGTLVDSYGTYSDAGVAHFMEDVLLQKKHSKIQSNAHH
jgi:hypothetical protein